MMQTVLALFLVVACVHAVSWPQGKYTLVKPNSGCPPGWAEGWRHQDNEDSDNKNALSSGHHFSGSFGRNTRTNYCSKIKEEKVTDWTTWKIVQWPKGTYCILRKGGKCPKGFANGHVHWDDEDSNNENAFGGTLPDGEYGRNTLIQYCCRTDGSSNTPIELPTSKPFYLVRKSSACQRVKGMNVRGEYIKTDDEDKDNKNSWSGNYPSIATGRNIIVYYCYYS
ncbi:unnamed protein product [Mytilus edulis]|uniref:Apextrin C-terminal domain-containing protein n=1 Tax=Mytilus edulis TaxID=6550 RepID=A0A8S3VEZ4_MYTED|nr:unnamed protein product [Mytilus edulis]